MEYLVIIWQSLNITIFVLSMMLIIDYLNVLTGGLWSEDLKKNKWKQVLIAAVLGLIPGCLGAYTVVSLYVHNIFGMGALVAAMIATSGDEAFFMFSIIPRTAFLVTAILFATALSTGFIINMFDRKKGERYPVKHFDIHDDEMESVFFDSGQIISQFRNITALRALLLTFIVVAGVLVAINFEDLLHGLLEQGPGEDHSQHLHPVWVGVTFSVVLGISLFVVATVSDHFLEEHLVNHILKKHFFRIFFWVLGTLLAMHFVTQYVDIGEMITHNLWAVLLIAVLVGIIPESGPHFIFIILFASGTLPLSILLASSIVQDGHGSLPLLAETQRGFLKVKGINIIAGLAVGSAGLLFGF